MRQSRRRSIQQVERAAAARGKCRTSELPPENHTLQGASARNARARLNIGVDLASIQKHEGGSTLDELAANAVMIAGVLIGMYAIYAYWITG